MSSDFIQLNRLFSEISKSQEDAEQQEIKNIWGFSQSKNWEEIEKEYRAVILAEAGAGKTEEMRSRARIGIERGIPAFFIRIEEIENGFENAFEIGETENFHEWINSNTEGWFYLDSVDEARLKDSQAFRRAIQRFANRIKDCAHRAHIIISSRPYAWKPRADRSFLDEVLYLPASAIKSSDDGEELTSENTNQSALTIYILKPLDKSRAQQFANAKGVVDFERLWKEVERLDLGDLTERPFDLESVTLKWNKDRKLEGRFSLLKHVIDQRLGEINPDRERDQPLPLEKARYGARMLAAAVILTGEAGIHVPDVAPEKSGIDAQKLLPDWHPNDIRSLLERAIFNDVIFGSVRFRHRETRELLAAEWFHSLLQNGDSRHSVESLIFRQEYGEAIISPRLRPVLPWLILFDNNIRKLALGLQPEIASQGGDPAELPQNERKKILSEIVERIASQKANQTDGDLGALARIAQEDLTSDVINLINIHRNSDDAIFFLARVVWQGGLSNCVENLIQIAVDPIRRKGIRIMVVRATMSCGSAQQKINIWTSLVNASTEIPREIVTELVKYCSGSTEELNLLLKAVVKATAPQRFKDRDLTAALHELIDRLPLNKGIDSAQPINLLIAGFNNILDRSPFIERRECQISREFAWLLAPAAHAAQRLINARSESATNKDTINILLKIPIANFWAGEDTNIHYKTLHDLIPKWPELNDHLFWENVDTARALRFEKNGEFLDDVWPILWPGPCWRFYSSDFPRIIQFVKDRLLQDDKLVALSLAYRLQTGDNNSDDFINQLTLVVTGNEELETRLYQLRYPQISKMDKNLQQEQKRFQLNQEKKRQKQNRDFAKWVNYLKENPDVVRNPPGLKLGEFSNEHHLLLHEMMERNKHDTWSPGADWQSLSEVYGSDVSHAFRDAAVAHWRVYKPQFRSEGANSNTTPYSLVFGMVGIEIEARETQGFPTYLNSRDLEHLLRYSTWELNGFPSWLEMLYKVFPRQVMKVILKEVRWELANTKRDERMLYIINDLAYYAPWLHKDLVAPFVEWIRKNDAPSLDTLSLIFRIMISGGISSDEMVTLATEKIASGIESEDLSFWHAMWVDADAELGIPGVKRWLEGLDSSRSSQAAQMFITTLMSDRNHGSPGFKIRSYRTSEHLKTLFLLMNLYIPVSEDIDRNGVGFSPTLRDDAQDLRGKLLNLLSDIKGKSTYIALKQLINEHPDKWARPWMERLAYKRAEEDGEMELWNTEQVAEFSAARTCRPTSYRQLFEVGIARLIDLKNWLERGNDSPYATWQRVDGETEMRILVSGWINHHPNKRFTCAQENELSNKQRPDIWIQCPSVSSAVPFELKLLDKGWSGPDLCERLRNQLAGDYLREETANCGVMLLIWQGKQPNKKWKIDGKNVSIAHLENALMEYWETISDQFPRISKIQVIVIDLTIREHKSDL